MKYKQDNKTMRTAGSHGGMPSLQRMLYCIHKKDYKPSDFFGYSKGKLIKLYNKERKKHGFD